MGKKTLEEIGRILLVSFITILISVTTTRRALLDKKMDKVDFLDYKTEHNTKHEQEYEDIKDIKEMVLWLYRNEISKNN